MGSVSKIEEIKSDPSNPSSPPKSAMLELFSSGDLPLTHFFIHRKLDVAMVAFLECLRQLGDFAEAHDANLKLPYKYCSLGWSNDRIVKDKIGDACVRLAFNQDETWTRALKYILTNAKWILAYASNLSSAPTARRL
jgi:beclin